MEMGTLPISWQMGTHLEGNSLAPRRSVVVMRVNAGPVIWLAAVLALPSFASAASVVQTEQVRAQLLAHAPEGVAPGRTVWLGLKLEHSPHWHLLEERRRFGAAD
jgi:hypothetical protein